MPDHAPLLAAAFAAVGLASGTTCVAWVDSQSGCGGGEEVMWPLWDPLVRGLSDASGLPVWSQFQEGGAMVPLIALGPLITSAAGILAVAVLIGWAASRRGTAPARWRVGLAAATAAVALVLLPLGFWGSLLFVAFRL